MRFVWYFLTWAHRQDIPLELETLFMPSMVERYCATQATHLSFEARSTARSRLRKVGRACTKRAPWAPEPKPFADNHTIMPPYSSQEVEGFWRAALTQRTPRRRQVARAVLVLGLGAGLAPREVGLVSASDVRIHPTDSGLRVVLLPDRTVPVLAERANPLRDLCRDYPQRPLVGPLNPKAKDPLGSARSRVEWPKHLPALRSSRPRTTWMATVLAQDLRVSEFMVIAGTISAKSIEAIAPHVAGRWDDDEYLCSRGRACEACLEAPT
ncbi:hypothetical protein [uncultured Tessaracoccus sp.]|uniref:hypothetical protein n=1 Tax=uncultured Tessaracoccus sp. TaxID=905023 RepID=UPI00260E0F4D|nr:hypothetical protein [uncultured Tessaracoccus sp.]